MDIVKIITEFEIVVNKLWRLLALFGIIFIAFLIRKIIKSGLKKSTKKFEKRQCFITAATLNAIGQGILFLVVAVGISLGIFSLELNEKVR